MSLWRLKSTLHILGPRMLPTWTGSKGPFGAGSLELVGLEIFRIKPLDYAWKSFAGVTLLFIVTGPLQSGSPASV